MKRQTNVLLILVAVIMITVTCGCSTANAVSGQSVRADSDTAQLRTYATIADIAQKPQEAAESAIAVLSNNLPVQEQNGVTAAEQQAEQESAEYVDEYWDSCEPYYGGGYYDNGDGFSWQGVREYEGRTETWYSSNVARHYRTSEWTVDDEGYYRTDEGYYVVAASDMPEGTVFEGSKGECIVLDSGCDDGVTDYYVSF